MIKKRSKQLSNIQSFRNYMAALSNLFYDYQSLSILSKNKQQLIQMRDSDPTFKNKKSISQAKPQNLPDYKISVSQIQQKKYHQLNKKWQFISQSNFVESISEIKIQTQNFQYSGMQQKLENIIENPNILLNYNPDQLLQEGISIEFISLINCIAIQPDILKRVFEYIPTDIVNQFSHFRVRLFDSGVYKQLLIKNSFPVNNMNELIFSKCRNENISPLIIQKAFAQLYNGYGKIKYYYCSDMLRDLTGAPIQQIDLKEEQQSLNTIKQGLQKKYIISVYAKYNTEDNMIGQNRSYIVKNYKRIQYNNHYLDLIKIKNPEGKKLSQLPPQMNVEIQKILNQSIIQQNGIFWLTFNTLRKNFQSLNICVFNPKYFYRYKTFSQKQLINNATSIYLKTEDTFHGYISLHQFHSLQQKQTFEVSRIIVARIKRKNDEIIQQIISGNFICKQSCTVEVNFSDGQYLIYCQINNVQKRRSNDEIFTISFYTQSIRYDVWSESVCVDRMLINYIKNNECGLCITKNEKYIRYNGDLFGYYIIYYENVSGLQMHERIDYETVNISIEQSEFKIEKGGNKLIKNRIGKQNNCEYKCSIKTKTEYSQ